jgi:pimeloyl-ACP methyl ester carboxylesterase
LDEQQAFAEVNGTRLYYEVAGSGHPLVLIHGLALDTRMWDDQFKTFAQHHQVIRYDLRGFGRSALPCSDRYSHADDLKALMAYLDIEQAAIVGLSMGGMVAIDFALAYPEATRALVSVDSGPAGFQFSPQWVASIRAVRQAGQKAGVEAAKDLWRKHPLFAPAMEQEAVAARMTQMVADYSGWHWVNTDPVQYLDPPAAQRLDHIKTPTLVVLGERDLPDVHAIAEFLQQHLPQVDIVVLPGVGHMANMEDSSRFNEVVLNFLAGL